MLTCPLCAAVGISTHEFLEAAMVRVHIRKVHRVPVAHGNARMGRPRAVGVGVAVGGAREAEENDEEHRDRLRLKRLISQYRVNGVTGNYVRQRARLIMDSGLSNLSKAETVVYALNPIEKINPEFESELVAKSRSIIANAQDSAEIGVVELSWSPVGEYIAAAWAYAQLKSAQVSAGWLPVRVDQDALTFSAISTKFAALVSEAFDLCVRVKAVERYFPVHDGDHLNRDSRYKLREIFSSKGDSARQSKMGHGHSGR
ncbi:hypothetical protein V1527DRAFT_450317 [Lipomyces starkeyi]